MGNAQYRALVSIHDLMPPTLSAVLQTLGRLEAKGIHPVTLLVVPGTGWNESGLRVLQQLQDRGHDLAGHGWTHRIGRLGGAWHTVHSRLLSRNAAEHLALSGDELVALVTHCHRWFGENGLKPPTLYVPPAWAMGAMNRETLEQLPFRYYEYFSGIYDSLGRRWQRLPLLGYEADSAWRVLPLRLWNRFNRILARKTGLIRIAIHPFDLQLRLAKDLLLQLQARPMCLRYPASPLRAGANAA